MLPINGLSPDVSSNNWERVLVAHVYASLLLRSRVVKKHMLPRFVFHLLRGLRGRSKIEYCVINRRSLSSWLGGLARRTLGLLDSRSIYAPTRWRLFVSDIPVRPCCLYHLILLPLISAWLQLMIGCRYLLLMRSDFIENPHLSSIWTMLNRPFSVCGFLHHLKMQLVIYRFLFSHNGILLTHVFLWRLIIFIWRIRSAWLCLLLFYYFNLSLQLFWGNLRGFLENAQPEPLELLLQQVVSGRDMVVLVVRQAFLRVVLVELIILIHHGQEFWAKRHRNRTT
jgi:hypothetical protein